MKIKLILTIFIIVFFIGCIGPLVPVIDLKGVNQQDLKGSQKIRTYIVGQMPPDGFTVLEPLEAWSCKNKTGDRPATKGNALRQLNLLAYRLGATALMDVEFTGHNTDVWGTNCWNSVHASEIAIKY